MTAEGCFSVWKVFHRNTTRGLAGGYDTLLSSSVAIESKAELALVPTAVIAVKQTITIKANITAYSTAVGPSSDTRNRRIFLVKLFIVSSKLSISKLGPRVERSGNKLKRQDTEVYAGDTDKKYPATTGVTSSLTYESMKSCFPLSKTYVNFPACPIENFNESEEKMT